MVSRVRTDDFIEKANQKHGYRYSYDKVVYQKSSVNVTIGCPKHGTFQQLPRNHLRGSGCPICAAESQEEKGEDVGRTKKRQAQESKFFPPGTLVALPFWRPFEDCLS